MKFLVTGCFGFIVFNFLKKINEEYLNDFVVSGIDLHNNPYSKLNYEIFKGNRNFKFHEADIVNINELDFQSKEFDLIILISVFF